MKKVTLIKQTFILAILGLMLSYSGCEKDEITFTVIFDTDGGNAIENQIVKKGEKLMKPSNPTKTEYSFVEWIDIATSEAYDFEQSVEQDLVLKATYVLDGNATVWTTKAKGDDVIITNYLGSQTSVIVPATIEGKKVVGIEGLPNETMDDYTNIFGGNADLPTTTVTSIDLSKAVYLKTIDLGAFIYCSALTDVTFGTELQYIGAQAFYGDENLKSIDLSATMVDSTGFGAFTACVGLTTLKLSNNMVKVGDFTFFFCAIETVELPATLQTIGFYGFRYCPISKLTIKKITTPLTELGYNAFGSTVIATPEGGGKIYYPSGTTYPTELGWSALATSATWIAQ